jgi:hypothetical protein
MKPFSTAFVLCLLLAFSTTCRAGGSIGWTEVSAKIAKEDPFLFDYIARTFDVKYVGGGVRVGHDKDGNSLVPGLEVGERIAPFEFLAKPRGAAGDFTLLLTFDTESYDDGKTNVWTVTVRKRLPMD